MEKEIAGLFKVTHIPTLIIGTLDKCKDSEPTSAIYSVLSCYTDEISEVKFFIASHSEPLIHSGSLKVFGLHGVGPPQWTVTLSYSLRLSCLLLPKPKVAVTLHKVGNLFDY